MERILKLSVDEFFSHIPNEYTLKKMSPSERRDLIGVFCGHEVKLYSLRYRTFQINHVCVNCGLEGTHFYLEKAVNDKMNKRYHFNMYGIDYKTDREVLFTKDHILPKSLGGPDAINNMQTMCFRCNRNKGNRISKELQSQMVNKLMLPKPLDTLNAF